VNIIGEHTDYNEGFVLPAAIDKAAYAAVGKREDDVIQLYSIAFKESFKTTVPTVQPSKVEWANYILGVVDQFLKNGFSVGGFNMVIHGDVPIGAGLSSSAAVECATGFALMQLNDHSIDKRQLAKMAQLAEHTFAGVNCGIMDMFASIFGKKDHLIKLDCRSLDFEFVPIAMRGVRILLLNTNVKHSLASTEYNTRRAQCEAGVALVRKHHPQINSLRDVTLEMLDAHVRKEDEEVYRRCKYVVEENQRLLTGCEALINGDVAAMGRKMFQSHDGLSKDYEVSCKELDYLVEQVRGNENVLGARMMGGGFGGCTINLVKEQAIEPLVENIKKKYERDMGLELTAYVAEIEDGTGMIC
jgi:galactokinase